MMNTKFLVVKLKHSTQKLKIQNDATYISVLNLVKATKFRDVQVDYNTLDVHLQYYDKQVEDYIDLDEDIWEDLIKEDVPVIKLQGEVIKKQNTPDLGQDSVQCTGPNGSASQIDTENILSSLTTENAVLVSCDLQESIPEEQLQEDSEDITARTSGTNNAKVNQAIEEILLQETGDGASYLQNIYDEIQGASVKEEKLDPMSIYQIYTDKVGILKDDLKKSGFQEIGFETDCCSRSFEANFFSVSSLANIKLVSVLSPYIKTEDKPKLQSRESFILLVLRKDENQVPSDAFALCTATSFSKVLKCVDKAVCFKTAQQILDPKSISNYAIKHVTGRLIASKKRIHRVLEGRSNLAYIRRESLFEVERFTAQITNQCKEDLDYRTNCTVEISKNSVKLNKSLSLKEMFQFMNYLSTIKRQDVIPVPEFEFLWYVKKCEKEDTIKELMEKLKKQIEDLMKNESQINEELFLCHYKYKQWSNATKVKLREKKKPRKKSQIKKSWDSCPSLRDVLQIISSSSENIDIDDFWVEYQSAQKDSADKGLLLEFIQGHVYLNDQSYYHVGSHWVEFSRNHIRDIEHKFCNLLQDSLDKNVDSALLLPWICKSKEIEKRFTGKRIDFGKLCLAFLVKVLHKDFDAARKQEIRDLFDGSTDLKRKREQKGKSSPTCRKKHKTESEDWKDSGIGESMEKTTSSLSESFLPDSLMCSDRETETKSELEEFSFADEFSSLNDEERHLFYTIVQPSSQKNELGDDEESNLDDDDDDDNDEDIEASQDIDNSTQEQDAENSSTLNDIMKDTAIKDSLKKIMNEREIKLFLSCLEIRKEHEYNISYHKYKALMQKSEYWIGDTVLASNVELFDILKITDDKLYLYHVKAFFGEKTRVAAAQIRISAEKIFENLFAKEKEGHFLLEEWYDTVKSYQGSREMRESLKRAVMEKCKSRDDFLEFFRSRKIVFVYAFLDERDRPSFSSICQPGAFTWRELCRNIKAKKTFYRKLFLALLKLKKNNVLIIEGEIFKVTKNFENKSIQWLTSVVDNKEIPTNLIEKMFWFLEKKCFPTTKLKSLIAKTELVNLKADFDTLYDNKFELEIVQIKKPWELYENIDF